MMAQPGAVRLEELRQYHENDRQWAARRQFLARHRHLYPGRKMDQLIALSVVWSNIVYIGNRYGEKLTEKVHQMAEGIDVGEMPSFELVPGAKAQKRPSSSDTGGQPLKKTFGPRPRFEPVHFVVSTVEEDKVFQKKPETNHLDHQRHSGRLQNAEIKPQTPNVCVTTSDHSDADENNEMELTSRPYVYDPYLTDNQSKNDFGSFMTKLEQNYSAKFESHSSTLSKDFRSDLFGSGKCVGQQGRKGIGFVKPPKKPGGHLRDRHNNGRLPINCTMQPLDNSAFLKHLSAIVKQNMVNPKLMAYNNHINFTHVLTQSIQACKINPVYIYAPIKDLPPGSVPRHTKLPPNGYACEVRCQGIYLATGFSWSKIGARDRAAELAIQVLQKPNVDVVTVTRKFLQGSREDVVAWLEDTRIQDLPPALKQQDSPPNNVQSSQQPSESSKVISTKPWSEFILTENAFDAIGILNNSAIFNKMTVDFKYDLMANNSWRCSVYVQDHFIAEGYGNKKNSKHAAAEAALKFLRAMQPNAQRPLSAMNDCSGSARELKDLVIYENAANPVCTLNDTAQFNKVNIEYVFERAVGLNWKCKVFMEQKFIAEAVGLKKTVKQEAAEAAVNVLKKTQPVVVNNLKKGPVEDAISRNQIRGVSNNEAYKQQIKEDNIGNQLLRKMGWTGGGLGKEGEGIAEPIAVKEQFNREGLGLMAGTQKITKRDIEQIIRNYAASTNQDDLTFSRELTNEERKQIHQMAQKYGLKSKSHGQGVQRFLVVSRKRNREDLIHQLKQEGQVGSYALLMPQD
ncbi:NF-kappa-B-repressing factor [Hyperolius riggenbachi]|uniref:NF-kappa-B-repressing factor n=1 Tax=Hyperolius riggenbachi TaxID=752182 RepID=UPI0035A32567